MNEPGLTARLLHTSNDNYRNVALPVFIFLSLLHLMVVLVNHYCFRTVAFDYSVYNFAFFDFAHFRVSPCPLYYSNYVPVTFMQDHFSLTLILLSPLYWLLGWLTGSYTLLIIQWLFINAGAWATYKLIVHVSRDHKMGLLSIIYFFVLFGRWSACDADCNLAIMGSAMIPVILYFFETGRLRALTLCFLFTVLVREDYPIWLSFIFFCLLLVHRRDAQKRQWALAFMVASLCFIVLTFKVFIPAFENQYKQYAFFEFSVIGKTPWQAFLFLVQHPLQALELLFVNHSGDPKYNSVKLDFYMVYILSGGFLLFYRPLYLIAFVPLILKKMYADAPVRWGIVSYYGVEVVSLLPPVVFIILSRLKSPAAKYTLGILVCLMTSAVTLYTFADEQKHADTKYINKHDFLRPVFYQSLFDSKAVNEAISRIPKTAGVSASSHLSTHLALREKIYYFPRVDDAEYIFLLKHDDYYYLSNAAFQKWICDLRGDTDWKLIDEKPDYIIFYRPNK